MVTLATKSEQYGAYKKQNVMTAGPAELTLMLYDGCIKNLKLAKIYLSEGSIEKTNESFIKAHNIVAELMQSLDMNYEISDQLLRLYDFIIRTMTEANIAKDGKKADVALELVTELRDTWQQAMRISRADMPANVQRQGFAAAVE